MNMKTAFRGAFVSRIAAIAPLAALKLTAGCENPMLRDRKAGYTPVETNASLVQAYNAFGFELYRTIAAAERSGNLFVSPPSVAIALSMTMNGAVGPTRDGIAKALHVQSVEPQTVNEGARSLQDLLKHADPKVQLSIANSIWARKDVKFDPAFLKTNEAYYGARASVLDFGDKKAADTINKWVEKETKGKIEEIVRHPINKDASMFLLNAVYFKGDWTAPFDKMMTADRRFTLPDGSTPSRSMMARQGSFQYADQDGYTAVRLPYGDGVTGMVVLLPDEGTKLSALTDRLSGAEWERLMGSLKEQQGEVILPRFKLEYETSLNKPLQSLGMSLAFDEGKADFSAMLVPPPSAYIGEVKHKTFVQVDEKGTEAAAVTSVEVRTTSAVTPTGFRLEANRPFLFVIHEQQTGAVLFVGSISDPKL